jgi:PAS domain S-box-containing protein
MAPRKAMTDDCGSCLLFGALEALTDGLVLIDPQGRILHLNHRAADLLGAAGGVIGEPLATIVRHPGLAAFLHAAAAEPGPVSAEIGLPAGPTLRATSSPSISASGEPLGRLVILRDVTQEKRIQVRLSAALAERLTRLAGPTTSDDPLPDLTRREREILALVAAGMTNSEIADRLHVSANTVASHLKNLYAKLGVRTRSQAAALAVAHGIVPG